MNAAEPYSVLADDAGTPIRWKAATLLSVFALVVTVALLLTKAGAKGEKLDAAAADIAELKALKPRVDRLETKDDEIYRRLGNMDTKLDQLLEGRRR